MLSILFGAVLPCVCSVPKNVYCGVHQRFVSFILSCYSSTWKFTKKCWSLDLTLCELRTRRMDQALSLVPINHPGDSYMQPGSSPCLRLGTSVLHIIIPHYFPHVYPVWGPSSLVGPLKTHHWSGYCGSLWVIQALLWWPLNLTSSSIGTYLPGSLCRQRLNGYLSSKYLTQGPLTETQKS